MPSIALNPRTQVRTVLTFLLLLGLFNAAYQIEKRVSGRIVDRPYSCLVAAAAAQVGSWLLPIPVEHREEITLRSNNATVVVRGGCNGLEALFLMVASVLAYPASWRSRGRALLLYLPALFVINLLRVIGMLYVTAVWPAYIYLCHDQLGQGFLIIFAFGFWMHYVYRVGH